MLFRRIVAIALIGLVSCAAARADSLTALSDSFWRWRAVEQPFSTDDIPRIERPAGLVVDWSEKSAAGYLHDLAGFERRWQALVPAPDSPTSVKVDYRLIGSALARVRWELAVEKAWKRNPRFYIDQTLGSVFELLLPPAPFSAARQREVIARVRRIPVTLDAAKLNLTDMRRPFAQLAIDALAHVEDDLSRTSAALGVEFSAHDRPSLDAALSEAGRALGQYRQWLRARLDTANPATAIGRDDYNFFLRNVALLPYSPEAMLTLSGQEWARTVAFEAYQEARLAGVAPAPIFPDADAQIAAEAKAERQIREFLGDNRILTVPAWMPHYRNLLLPTYLEALQDLGVTDDLTGPSRLDQDGVSYIRKPRADLGFFYLSTARDPRPIIVHEGVPGHYFQLCLGWNHPDPIRRHYYDSSSNEGIGFYAEEMMLQAGLFDDNPRTRSTIYSFMRLRALRVEVDVRLALGDFSLQQAADYLEQTVPMDRETALEEAASFASAPGQAISYQVGKLQITRLLADTRRTRGSAFSLLEFNDFVWLNGNVPLSLQRWELLGDPGDVPSPVPSDGYSP